MASYKDPEEQYHAIRANDGKALEDFYQHNYPKLEKYVIDNNGTADEAKDIYQEAFIAMWRNIQLDRFELKADGSLEGYLYRIARNKWVDHLRATKRQKTVSMTDGFSKADEQTGITEEEEKQLNDIKKNFQQLGQMCKDVLERYYYRKQSMRTIAGAMEWTEATAKNNKYRCLQRLRELLKK